MFTNASLSMSVMLPVKILSLQTFVFVKLFETLTLKLPPKELSTGEMKTTFKKKYTTFP